MQTGLCLMEVTKFPPELRNPDGQTETNRDFDRLYIVPGKRQGRVNSGESISRHE